MLEQWLLGKFIAMTAVGVLTYLGLTILGMPIALTLAVLAAILTFVPYIGPLLALLPAALIALLQSPAQAAYVIALYLGVQLVESYILTPVVQKRTPRPARRPGRSDRAPRSGVKLAVAA